VGNTIRNQLADFPGFSFDVMPFLTERIRETLSGTRGALAVKVYGDDLEKVDQAAQTIARALNRIPGAKDVRAEPQAGQPELVVQLRPEAAKTHGLRNQDVLEAVHTAYQGAEITQVYEK